MADVVTEEIRIAKKGIHCSGCEATIERYLSRLPGVQQVKASEETQLVTVGLDPSQVSAAEVREKLDDLGYTTVAL